MKLVIFDFAGTVDCPRELEADFARILKELSLKYKLAIISSTHSSYIKNYLNDKNLLEEFAEILGSDFDLSKADRIRNLLKKYSIKSEETVYVTDTVGDINEARGCGVKSIAVTWGFHEEKTLREANPEKIISNPADLIKAIVEF